ncbi:hypothetical protein NAF17_12555 [Mucilaginibacter sp. RB4R14]|uniref:hypothetical protein n=1 Tax=Mucilaginibacter aurantiaciroseus TaxID=2949308 RepID=UPI002091B8B6|nr:hypothetical protein [Mucilaginibacter aurantiaciroseus]MCO5936372.1 hypothetical protein [Mucilaginibacter aurantiaciroseus]
MNRAGRDRGWSPMTTDQFEYLRAHGPLIVGDAQETIDKIMAQYELFGKTRFLHSWLPGMRPTIKH